MFTDRQLVLGGPAPNEGYEGKVLIGQLLN